MISRLKKSLENGLNKAGNLLLSPPYGGVGYYHNFGPRLQRKIALTFDDGPSKPSTEQILEVMSHLNVLGTFFCLGLHVQNYPDLIQRMYQAGHVIGNHSMYHSRTAGLKLTGGDHIDDAAKAIAAVIDCQPRLYRPPWGWLTPWEGQRLASRGYTVIGWDIYPDDWKIPEVPAEKIGSFIAEHIRPGSIVLLHDAFSLQIRCEKRETARMVKQLVPHLRDKGYEFVTVPELLGVPAYGPQR